MIVIKTMCFSYDISVDNYKGHNSQFEIVIKLVLTSTYKINLEDWDMNDINKIAKTHSKVSGNITLWL